MHGSLAIINSMYQSIPPMHVPSFFLSLRNTDIWKQVENIFKCHLTFFRGVLVVYHAAVTPVPSLIWSRSLFYVGEKNVCCTVLPADDDIELASSFTIFLGYFFFHEERFLFWKWYSELLNRILRRKQRKKWFLLQRINIRKNGKDIIITHYCMELRNDKVFFA